MLFFKYFLLKDIQIVDKDNMRLIAGQRLRAGHVVLVREIGSNRWLELDNMNSTVTRSNEEPTPLIEGRKI